jgi:hypothetical protein
MTRNEKAFLTWLAFMIPLVIGLTVIGLTCQDCQLPIEQFQ